MAETFGTTRLEGARELDRLLRDLPKKMRGRALAASVRAGANVVREEAKNTAPVDTGALRDSIVARRKRTPGAAVTYRIGPKRSAFYGLFIEYGTSRQAARPWLRPAFDSVKNEVINKMGQSLGRAIEREAKKLAGPLRKSGLVKRRRR